MPTYDYVCEHCQHRFEAFQSMTDPLLTECPECGKEPRRLIGAGAAAIFKGSGFYCTDYRRPAPPKTSGKPAPVEAAVGPPV